jgi:hypothetical protein
VVGDAVGLDVGDVVGDCVKQHVVLHSSAKLAQLPRFLIMSH